MSRKKMKFHYVMGIQRRKYKEHKIHNEVIVHRDITNETTDDFRKDVIDLYIEAGMEPPESFFIDNDYFIPKDNFYDVKRRKPKYDILKLLYGA